MSDAHDTTMSNSSDALVGAAGINARNRGLSHEITAGASTSSKSSSTSLGIVAGRLDQVRRTSAASSTGVDRVVERHRIEREPLARVREHRVGDAVAVRSS